LTRNNRTNRIGSDGECKSEESQFKGFGGSKRVGRCFSAEIEGKKSEFKAHQKCVRTMRDTSDRMREGEVEDERCGMHVRLHRKHVLYFLCCLLCLTDATTTIRSDELGETSVVAQSHVRFSKE
jgi:hypothetical protein